MPRHPHVHQHDVGRARRGQRDGLGAVRRLADDLDVGLGVEQRPEAARTSAWSSASRTRVTPRRRQRQPRLDAPTAVLRPARRRASRRAPPPARASRAARGRAPAAPARRAAAVVGDEIDTPSRVHVHGPRRAPRGVPEHVRQRLLHDPVAGEPDPASAASGVAGRPSTSTAGGPQRGRRRRRGRRARRRRDAARAAPGSRSTPGVARSRSRRPRWSA